MLLSNVISKSNSSVLSRSKGARLGNVDGFIRKGKEVSTASRKWRCYSAIWNFLKPLRRILLAIYRRI